MLRRQSDEQDSTTSTWLNYTMATLVIVGIFVVEIIWDKGILDGTLIGILISNVFDALKMQNAYFFPSQRPPKHGDDNGNGAPHNEQQKPRS